MPRVLPVVKKILAGTWKFVHAMKTRTPSTVVECVEDSPPKYTAFCRPWLILVLAIPLMYNLYVYSVWPDKDDGDIQILRSVSTDSDAKCGLSCNLEQFANETMTQLSVKVGIRCRMYSLASSSRAGVMLGGYYKPTGCLPLNKVAIIVPFRHREANLVVFLFKIHPFLIAQRLEYRVFVIEQSGNQMFNKGRLLNAAFDQVDRFDRWDCLVFHDVDLLPLDFRIFYSCPAVPTQMCVSVVRKNHEFPLNTRFGVMAMTDEHFKKVNGFSNLYWESSGGADIDLLSRMRAAKLPVNRYDEEIGKFTMLPRPTEYKNPKRPLISKGIKQKQNETDGISNLHYKIKYIKLRTLYTHIVVDINPNNDTTD